MTLPQQDQTNPNASVEAGQGYPPANTLGIGNKDGMVSIDHPALDTDENGVGHIIFSPDQAFALARMLTKHADIAAGGDCCLHCGCTDHTPCVLGFGEPCCWFAKSVCSNPECLAASVVLSEVGAR